MPSSKDEPRTAMPMIRRWLSYRRNEAYTHDQSSGVILRLRAADAQMLAHERLHPDLHAECPWLLTFSGSRPEIAALREHVASRMTGLPQLRCRIVDDPIPAARPSWVSDPAFDLSYHVREVNDDRYAGEQGWLRFIEHRMATSLDRRRPLWELWLLPTDGAEQFAMVLYHHHALLDGHSGLHVLRTLLSTTVPTPVEHDTSTPQAPTRWTMLSKDVRDMFRAFGSVGSAFQNTVRNPIGATRSGVRRLGAIAAMLRILSIEHAPSIRDLNRPIGPKRRPVGITIAKSDLMSICTEARCFPNTVYLTVVAGGLGHWLRARGKSTLGLVLRGGAAVDCGGDERRRRVGNYFSGVQVLLPVDEMDERTRLSHIRTGAKRITQDIVEGANALIALGGMLPVQLLGAASSVAFGPRHFNVGVSHLTATLPDAQLVGRKLTGLRSWTFLFNDHVMTFVAQLFDDQMTINLLIDPDAVPDVDILLDGMRITASTLALPLGNSDGIQHASVS